MKLTEKTQALPLISIVVPVYNVQEYVGECVESLCRQTYTNLEIVLVDDGSTDGSAEVCDAYEGRDSRVKVIHQTNGGPSSARNAGLDAAQGEYIAFVDGDDLVSPFYIEELHQLLNKYHADIAACAYERDRGEWTEGHEEEAGQCENEYATEEICLDAEQMLRQWHGRYKRYETVVWNKLYHRSVFDGSLNKCRIRYPAYRRDEDITVSHLLIQNADRVALTSKQLYYYRSRPGSLTAKDVMVENMRQNLGAQRERMVFFRRRKYWGAYFRLFEGYVMHVVWFVWRRIRGFFTALLLLLIAIRLLD